jgi:hypothetical protein
MSNTPGNWIVSPTNPFLIIVENSETEDLEVQEVAETLHDDNPDNIAMAAADALLIAAAPNLLTACMIVKAFLDRLEDSAYDPMDMALANMRRQVHAPLRAALEPAIAKAMGKL